MSYWEPGRTILWRYTRPGHPSESVRPVRVFRDDEAGLVAWLAAGSQVLRPVLADGRDLRAVPLGERFDSELHGRANRLDVWRGRGILKVAPAGVPWSMWLFWGDDGFAGWYVNLESVHQRDGDEVRTEDHVLDIVVQPDRSTARKDEDELAVAVRNGRFTAEEAAGFARDASDVEALIRRWDSPFRDGWEDWAPDPGWLPAELSPDYVRRAAFR